MESENMYRIVAHQNKNVESLNGIIMFWVNLLAILVNLFVLFFLFEFAILMVENMQIPYIALYSVHVIFTLYNLLFTIHWSPHYIIEGVFTLISFVITIYSVVVSLVLFFWIWNQKPEPEYVVFIFLFVFVFFMIPMVQSITYRLYRQTRNITEKTQECNVAYNPCEEQPVQKAAYDPRSMMI